MEERDLHYSKHLIATIQDWDKYLHYLCHQYFTNTLNKEELYMRLKEVLIIELISKGFYTKKDIKSKLMSAVNSERWIVSKRSAEIPWTLPSPDGGEYDLEAMHVFKCEASDLFNPDKFQFASDEYLDEQAWIKEYLDKYGLKGSRRGGIAKSDYRNFLEWLHRTGKITEDRLLKAKAGLPDIKDITRFPLHQAYKKALFKHHQLETQLEAKNNA